MGYAEILQSDYEVLGKTEIDEIATQITQCSQRLYRVVENYLLYAQTEIFKHDPQAMEKISNQRLSAPRVLIRDVAMSAAQNMGRTADITCRTEDVDIRISWDSFRKIIAELMDNALKFSEAGTPINISAESIAGKYHMSIRDLGRGMTPEQILRVGAYMQFGRKLYEQQGLGLGLIIAKSLVELHGGNS